MRLIGLAVVLAVGIALTPLIVEAQSVEKVYRIGYLGNATALAPVLVQAGALVRVVTVG